MQGLMSSHPLREALSKGSCHFSSKQRSFPEVQTCATDCGMREFVLLHCLLDLAVALELVLQLLHCLLDHPVALELVPQLLHCRLQLCDHPVAAAATGSLNLCRFSIHLPNLCECRRHRRMPCCKRSLPHLAQPLKHN